MEVDSTASTGTNIGDIFAATLCLPYVLEEEHDDVELDENVVDVPVATTSFLREARDQLVNKKHLSEGAPAFPQETSASAMKQKTFV